MDEEKIEFLDLKRRAKTLFEEKKQEKNRKNNAGFSRNATNPIMGAFLEFRAAKKFDIEDL